MSRDKLLALSAELSNEAYEVLAAKSKDYADKDDALAAFRMTANELGLDMKQVWGVFFTKHVRSVLSYVKEGELESESLRSRIIDLINYLTILDAIDKENSGT